MYKAFWCESCARFITYARATVLHEVQVTIINHGHTGFLRLEADPYVLSTTGEDLEFTCPQCDGLVEYKSFEICPHGWVVDKDLALRKCWICHRTERAETVLVFPE